MSHHLKDRILAQYPGWHTHPIRLATPEMQHPHVVLKDFFSAYHLTDIRVCLRGGLSCAIRRNEAPAMDYLHLHDSVERLIEAARLLYSNKKGKQQKKKKK